MLSKEDKLEVLKLIQEEKNKAQTLAVEICRDQVELPAYTHHGDAGMDIHSAEDVILLPGETKIIPTVLKIDIKEGYELQIRPRSGISLKTPLRIANTPGTIDSGYRDEIGIIVTNTSTQTESKEIYSTAHKGNKNGIYQIKKGDRIAQLVLCKYEKIEWKQVEPGEMETIGHNRGGGFGHSGTN